MSDEIFKSAIKETSKNIHDKIKEAERKAQEKLEADRKAAAELEESARIKKKINDFKIATSCAMKIFAGSKDLKCKSMRFETFIKCCKDRIEAEISRTKSPTIELSDDEFQMILDTLVEDGYIIRRKGTKPPLDIHVTYQYNSGQ